MFRLRHWSSAPRAAGLLLLGSATSQAGPRALELLRQGELGAALPQHKLYGAVGELCSSQRALVVDARALGGPVHALLYRLRHW